MAGERRLELRGREEGREGRRAKKLREGKEPQADGKAEGERK